LLIELVHIDLELRLKAGEAARAEEYLARYPELAGDRAAAVELIAAEHGLRRRSEPHLSPDEYWQRFPHYRAELREQIEPPADSGVALTALTVTRPRPRAPAQAPRREDYELLG